MSWPVHSLTFKPRRCVECGIFYVPHAPSQLTCRQACATARNKRLKRKDPKEKKWQKGKRPHPFVAAANLWEPWVRAVPAVDWPRRLRDAYRLLLNQTGDPQFADVVTYGIGERLHVKRA
jgi:hypothetical protein